MDIYLLAVNPSDKSCAVRTDHVCTISHMPCVIQAARWRVRCGHSAADCGCGQPAEAWLAGERQGGAKRLLCRAGSHRGLLWQQRTCKKGLGPHPGGELCITPFCSYVCAVHSLTASSRRQSVRQILRDRCASQPDCERTLKLVMLHNAHIVRC